MHGATIGLSERDFLIFLLVLVRMTGLFVIAPVFGHASLPRQVKVGLAVASAIFVFPSVLGSNSQAPGDTAELALMVGRELLVGTVIGYIALLIFAATQMAGELVDTQIGFGLANIVDPSFGGQVTVIGQYQFLIATMLYLTVNGHHILVGAIVRSYGAVPLGSASIGPELLTLIIAKFSELLKIAARMAIPAVACLIITEIALGVLARSVPQMNVLMVGFPLKIIVGFVVMGLAAPAICGYMQGVFGRLPESLSAVLRSF
ncbi:MAG: flagellar biosynthetic protein FliR [Clostridia bacterium]|nr:flagellar biosynthetic protein FliR [Clostridia bacterium]